MSQATAKHDELVVTQSDRDAAEALLYGSKHVELSAVHEAFARHRIAALTDQQQDLVHYANLYAERSEQLSASDAKITDLQAELDGLRWFGENKRLELSWHSPTYCDDDDTAMEWRVTERRGNINDREWEIVGSGETPSEAILAARQALSQHPHDSLGGR